MTDADGSRVLVIDDEHVIGAALRRVLAEEGVPVECAESAEEGLAAMGRSSFAVAVVDIRLPGMSGLDFLEVARGRAPEMVLILMTGYTSNDQATEAFGRGAFTFLPKPFTFDEAASAVARALRFYRLPESDRTPSQTEGVLLGVQAWGRKSNGESLLGVTEVFLRTMPKPERVQLPVRDYPMVAGDVLLRTAAVDGRTYTAWSPLGGRVVAVNERLIEEPALLLADPYGEGWIARVR